MTPTLLNFIDVLQSPRVLQYAIFLGVLVIIGWPLPPFFIRDLRRFSFVRIWAIASVVYLQAIRRRVLWMTPVVVLAVIVIAHLAQPIDAQDDIRQTTKFFLFAAGMLVVLVTILTAATNLPKEIENRVIYTVATKPATRLEIVLGKVVGFARISGMMLLVMGLMGFGYLKIKEWRLRQNIAQQLAQPGMDAAHRRTLEYYASAGLLHSRSFQSPGKDMSVDPTVGLEFFAGDERGEAGWSAGMGEQAVYVPFENFAAKIPAEWRSKLGKGAFMIRAVVEWRADPTRAKQTPTTGPGAAEAPDPPRVNINILDQSQATFLTSGETLRPGIVKDGMFIPADRPNPRGFELSANEPLVAFGDAEGLGRFDAAGSRVYFEVMGIGEYQYRVKSFEVLLARGLADAPFKPAGPVVHRSRFGTHGQQLRGERDGKGPVAVWTFKDAAIPSTSSGMVPFELRVGVERSGELEAENDDATVVEMTVLHPSGQRHVVRKQVESKRPVYVDLPEKVVAGGNFAIEMRSVSAGQWIGVRMGPEASLRLVVSNHPFVLNLAKSLLVMWLLSVLVSIICVFCSTFVSWPIAIVLSVVMLMGHWAFTQLDVQKGMERQIFQDVFGRGASAAQTSAGTEVIKGMNQFLAAFASLLPDVSQFGAIEPVEKGTSVSPQVMAESAKVCLLFGVPLIILTYVFLRFKEVAP